MVVTACFSPCEQNVGNSKETILKILWTSLPTVVAVTKTYHYFFYFYIFYSIINSKNEKFIKLPLKLV